MNMRSRLAPACLAVISGVLAIGASARANVIGLSVGAKSQVNAGAIESRADAAIDPGAEILYGDANDFAWMIPGDYIDYAPYPNVSAPNSLFINLGANHGFVAGDVLHLSFELPAPYQFGVAAITQAITVNQVSGAISGNLLTLDILDMVEVSQGDFGGAVKVIFSIVPEPASAGLLLAGAGALFIRRRP